MKRETFNIRVSCSEVVPVSGYAVSCAGERFGAFLHGGLWFVHELTSGSPIVAVSRLRDVSVALADLFRLDRFASVRAMREAFGDCNAEVVPRSVVLSVKW